MKYGFIQVAAAVPAVKVADTSYNVEETKRLISDADAQGAEIICFPELGLTAYSCQDLFTQQFVKAESEQALISLMNDTRKLDIISIVGLPVQVGGLLLNCAAVIQHGQLLGLVPKLIYPTTVSSMRNAGLPQHRTLMIRRYILLVVLYLYLLDRRSSEHMAA